MSSARSGDLYLDVGIVPAGPQSDAVGPGFAVGSIGTCGCVKGRIELGSELLDRHHRHSQAQKHTDDGDPADRTQVGIAGILHSHFAGHDYKRYAVWWGSPSGLMP